MKEGLHSRVVARRELMDLEKVDWQARGRGSDIISQYVSISMRSRVLNGGGLMVDSCFRNRGLYVVLIKPEVAW